MPTHPVNVGGRKGWQWGSRGKRYFGPGAERKAKAQAAAAVENGYREGGLSKAEMLRHVFKGEG